MSGSYILALLVEMAFDSGARFGEVFADQVGGESWPGGKVSAVDSLCPCGWHWVSACSMEEADMVCECGCVVCAVGTGQVCWDMAGVEGSVVQRDGPQVVGGISSPVEE